MEILLGTPGWSAVYGAGLTAFGAIFAMWLGKRMDLRRTRDGEITSGQVEERQNIRLAYQSIIDRLSGEQEKLWKMFHEMQEALALCEQAHRDDAVKIAAGEARITDLERQNAGQARQIQRLELNANGDG
jgi:hypothetical protein